MKKIICIALAALCLFSVSCSREQLGLATQTPSTESGEYFEDYITVSDDVTEESGDADDTVDSVSDGVTDVTPSESVVDGTQSPTETGAESESQTTESSDSASGKPVSTTGKTDTSKPSVTTAKTEVTTAKSEVTTSKSDVTTSKPTVTTAKTEVTTAPKEDEPVELGPGVLDMTSNAYSGMLSGDDIIKIEITMNTSELKSMRTEAADLSVTDKGYHKVMKVTVNGVSCTTAGIKVRGNEKYVAAAGSNRYSYRLKFGKYSGNGKGNVNGLDELCLNNMAYDPSFLREYLTYKAFEYLDADAPLVSLATVSINGEPAGLYLAVEAIDNSLLDRCFGSHSGNLYKAGEGSALLSGTTTFELKAGSDTAKSNITKLTNALSSGKGIESVLDVSSVLKYAAVNAVITNEDSYMGSKAQNYFLYEKGGKLSILPWDYNLAFGTDTSARKDSYTVKTSLITSSVMSPYFGVSADQRPLVSKLLSNSKYKNEYLTYVKKLTQFLDTVQRDMPQLEKMIKSTVSADSTKFYSYSLFEKEFTNSNSALFGFIKSRCEAVKSEIK